MNTAPRRILLIEDETEFASLICMLLKHHNYEVCVAATAGNGLAQVAQWNPDLVLLDVSLPDVDGWIVCERIRESLTIPIIFVTSASSRADITYGLHLGADDYLVKPFRMKELLARIEKVIERRHPPQKYLPPSQKQIHSLD